MKLSAVKHLKRTQFNLLVGNVGESSLYTESYHLYVSGKFYTSELHTC